MSGIAAGVAIVGAVTGVISAISSGQQQKKALQAQLNLGQADARNKVDLEKALQRTNSDNTKIKIITDSIANIRSAQSSAIISATLTSRQASADAEKRNLVIVSVGGGIVLVGALAVLKFAK
jgi:hypothetical protein